MRYLVCSFSSKGMLFPMVGLALELRRRGHDVAFATGPASQAVLDDADLVRLAGGDVDGTSFDLRFWGNPFRTALDVRHAEDAIARFRPDALVTHMLCQAPLILRERRRIPTAVLGFASYLWPAARPTDARLSSHGEVVRGSRFEETLRLFNRARALFRMAPCEVVPDDLPLADDLFFAPVSVADFPLLGDLFMVRTVPEFEADLGALPDRVHAVGACTWAPPGDGADTWEGLCADMASDEHPLLYVQHGQVFRGSGFWRELVAALGERQVQVVASAGRMGQEVGSVPRNFVVRDHVPQDVVLPRARGAIFAGHSTAVLGALTHGVPSVVIPQGGETPDNAERLERVGCALRITPDALSPQRLASAVDELLNSARLRDGAARMRSAFSRLAGFGLAADLVEALARTGRPVRRDERYAIARAGS